MNYLRTKRDGCFQLYENPYWGQYLKKIDDPEAHLEELAEASLKFELKENFPKIPAKLWCKVLNLYFNYANKKGTEVGVEFFRKESDPTQWRCLVPEQEVTGESVYVKDTSKTVDIETGETVSTYPPEGWVFAASSHSHGFLSCTWSSVDIEDEKSKPGLHILVRSIDKTKRTYVLETCIVQQYNRYTVNYNDVIDTEYEGLTDEDLKYHPNVRKCIKEFARILSPFNFNLLKKNNVPFHQTIFDTGNQSVEDEISELASEFEYYSQSTHSNSPIEEKIESVYGELLRSRHYTISKSKIRSVLEKENFNSIGFNKKDISEDDLYDDALSNLEFSLEVLKQYHTYKEIKQLIQKFLL